MRKAGKGRKPVHLFWTGGWDSTLRLLQLLLHYRLPVRTHYVVDPGRSSVTHEFRSMDRIRRALCRDHPWVRRLWGPTEIAELGSIAPARELTEAYRAIRRGRFLGSQFEWLGRYCKERGLRGVEVCVEPGLVTQPQVFPIAESIRKGPYSTYRVRPGAKGPMAVLIRYFEWPFLDTPKEETWEKARKEGWGPYLVGTWFCHRPTPRGRPCGYCNPCGYVVKGGFGWRIPWDRRVVGAVARPLKNISRRLLGKGPTSYPGGVP